MENYVDIEIPLRWADMDAYGHINNVQIVRLMEEARVMVFGTPSGTGAETGPDVPDAPIEVAAWAPEGALTLISEHRVKYLRQLAYRRGMPVRIRITVSAIKGASIELDYSFFDSLTGEKAVTASSTIVFVDEKTGRPVRLTDQQKAALEPYRSDR